MSVIIVFYFKVRFVTSLVRSASLQVGHSICLADTVALAHPGLFLMVARSFQEHAQGSTYIIPLQPLPLALWALVFKWFFI